MHARPSKSYRLLRVLLPAITMVVLAAILVGVWFVPRLLRADQGPVQAQNPPAIPEVSIVAHDYAFSMPDTLPAGLVRIRMTNAGDEVHQAQFFHLLPQHTATEFINALLAGGPAATRAIGVPAGGTDDMSPGLTAVVINNLAAGDYVVACLVVTEGHPHFHLGMIGAFTAVAADARQTPREPTADGTMSEAGMAITLPAALGKPGLRTFQVSNSGPGIHALDILQPLPGKTVDDIQSYLRAPAGTPPFLYLGGMGGQAPGSNGWIELHLLPGDYVAVCLVVDPVSHTTHASMGMMAAFTVA